MVFYNLQGTPSLVLCADGTGVAVGRYGAKNLYGGTFTWGLEDARHIAKNAVFFIAEIDIYGGRVPVELSYFLDVEAQVGPYVGRLIGMANPDCSIEQGLAYLETVEVPE